MLTELDGIPPGLLDMSASQLYTVLPGPTLIHLRGRRDPPIFVSVLQHGNEHTGWEAARQLLREYEYKELPRSVSLFIGNIEAARHNQRFLDGQVDYNRSWGSATQPPEPLMQKVLASMQARDVFLSVDVHNNTGKNPHYACLNRLEAPYLNLARLFSRTVVYFIRPETVQSMAFAKFCPAVTVESGLSGDQAGTLHVKEFLNACLHLSELSNRPPPAKDLDVYHTLAVVKVAPELSLGYGDVDAQVRLDTELEYFNFRESPEGTCLGQVDPEVHAPLQIINDDGQDIAADYIEIDQGRILTRKGFIPAMITRNVEVIRQDCLCYLMERYPLN